MLAELVLAMTEGIPVSKLASSCHAYPAMGFALMEMAAEVVYEGLEEQTVCYCCSVGCWRTCLMPPLKGFDTPQ